MYRLPKAAKNNSFSKLEYYQKKLLDEKNPLNLKTIRNRIYRIAVKDDEKASKLKKMLLTYIDSLAI